MNKVKMLVILTVCCCVYALTGCRTTLRASYRLERRTIRVLSEPEGATVTQLFPSERDSRELGKTPLRRVVLVMTDLTFQGAPFSEARELSRYADSAVLRVEKEGYQPHNTIIGTRPDDTATRKCVLKPLSEQ